MTGLAAAAWVPLTVLFSSQFPGQRRRARHRAALAGQRSFARMVATGVNGTLNQMGGYELAFYPGDRRGRAGHPGHPAGARNRPRAQSAPRCAASAC